MSSEEQDDTIKERKGQRRRRVDRRTDRRSIRHKILHNRHHFIGSVGIQSRGWLIEEQHPWIGDQGNANVHTLGLNTILYMKSLFLEREAVHLATRDPSRKGIADLGELARLQRQFLNPSIHLYLFTL